MLETAAEAPDASIGDAMRNRIRTFASPAPAKSASESAAAQAKSDSEAWLERIRGLREAGRMREAVQSLHEFRLRYPEHAIPQDLRSIAEASR